MKRSRKARLVNPFKSTLRNQIKVSLRRKLLQNVMEEKSSQVKRNLKRFQSQINLKVPKIATLLENGMNIVSFAKTEVMLFVATAAQTWRI